MYSVLRFTIDSARHEQLNALGEAMNALEPGRYQGPRPRRDGFAVELEASDVWGDHLAAIEHVLRAQAQVLRGAIALGARLTIDVAIDGDDLARTQVFLSLQTPPPVLAALAQANVALEVTVYRS